ncbi:SPOR domain-containing protein [Polyangium jinanense]|uniref:SPOR domain-containing protein n=1 Tax=Polyangium jinanense TaxID=2829994 RepID=A0A9X3X4P1_9BACT|nr:SPOR domain-containing protein [Polyangium jinanense]MDC3957969.1 SPOR domain-containing protein [Polyangium jinanense]MDC3983522.1 SPOR domain-containing protein [Polyangium jinanense]
MTVRSDIGDGGAIKNLEDIQEADPASRPSRASALVLASLGGACIVFAAVALLRAPVKEKPTNVDPLGDLVAKAHPAGVKVDKKPDLAGHEITFPGMLSDTKNTTALEAVRSPQSTKQPPPEAADAPLPLPPPETVADRLPPSPLPAQHILQAPPDSAAGRDTLTQMAKHVAREDGAEAAEAGGPGQYQLQVSSFKTQQEADKFAAALRRRGHRAYVEPAMVKGRGLWYRVRIGPFKYKHSATIYRQDFEAKERLVTFIVEPPKKDAAGKLADESAAQ